MNSFLRTILITICLASMVGATAWYRDGLTFTENTKGGE